MLKYEYLILTFRTRDATMHEEILSFVENGNFHGLEAFLFQNITNLNAKNDSTIINDSLQKLIDIFDPDLESTDAFIQKFNLIRDCIQLLIVFGFIKNPEEFKSNIEPKLDIIEGQYQCDIINLYHNDLEVNDCLLEYLLTLLDPKKLETYLNYANCIPNLKSELSDINDHILALKNQVLLFQKKQQQKKLLNFFELKLKNELQYNKNSLLGRSLTQLYPCLSECHCHGHERGIRVKLEKQLLTEVSNRFKLSESLNYLSLGSGGLLQDFIIITQLLKKGYKNINISLIEPGNYNGVLRYFNAVILAIADELGATVVMQDYLSIQQFKTIHPDKQLHIAVAIDFENPFKAPIFSDLMQTHQLLVENGFFLMSYDDFKLVITKQSAKLLMPSAKLENITSSLQALANINLEKEDSLSIAITTAIYPMETWVGVLPMLANLPQHFIEIAMINPKKQTYNGLNTEENNAGFTKSDIETFLSLLFDNKKTITVSCYDSKDTLLNNSPNEGYDIILQLGLNSNDFDSWFQNIENTHKHKASKGYHFCMAQYSNEEKPHLIIEGLIKSLPQQEQVKDHLTKLASIYNKIYAYIKESKSLNSSENKKFILFKALLKKDMNWNAVMFKRIKEISDYLISDPNPELERAIKKLLLPGIENQQAIFNFIYSFTKETILVNNNNLIAWTENKFSVSLSNNNNIVITSPVLQ